ncbi:hypothetical protein MTP99_004630 [Tenebrio molitor]|nr:hypothetical protein MTP99_004630 [Tenebrio molitor]
MLRGKPGLNTLKLLVNLLLQNWIFPICLAPSISIRRSLHWGWTLTCWVLNANKHKQTELKKRGKTP